MTLTKEQKEKYLQDPNYCPYCGSGNIISDKLDMDGSGGMADVDCNECGKSWVDSYGIVNIFENDIPGTDI